jgi:hypothetical protein
VILFLFARGSSVVKNDVYTGKSFVIRYVKSISQTLLNRLAPTNVDLREVWALCNCTERNPVVFASLTKPCSTSERPFSTAREVHFQMYPWAKCASNKSLAGDSLEVSDFESLKATPDTGFETERWTQVIRSPWSSEWSSRKTKIWCDSVTKPISTYAAKSIAVPENLHQDIGHERDSPNINVFSDISQHTVCGTVFMTTDILINSSSLHSEVRWNLNNEWERINKIWCFWPLRSPDVTPLNFFL